MFLLIWNGVLGKLADYGRTMVRFRKISKWYALASLCGGPMAIFGSYMAMGYVGPVFAAITSLFYPVVGALIARFWYQEEISGKAALGMAVIIMGGVVIYGPGLLGTEDLTNNYAQSGPSYYRYAPRVWLVCNVTSAGTCQAPEWPSGSRLGRGWRRCYRPCGRASTG